MLVMHFGHPVAEMPSHDATGYWCRDSSCVRIVAPLRDATQLPQMTLRAMRLLLRPLTRAYRGLLDFAFGSPCLVARAQLFGASELSDLKGVGYALHRQGYEMHLRLCSDFSHKHFVTYSQSVPKEHHAFLDT